MKDCQTTGEVSSPPQRSSTASELEILLFFLLVLSGKNAFLDPIAGTNPDSNPQHYPNLLYSTSTILHVNSASGQYKLPGTRILDQATFTD